MAGHRVLIPGALLVSVALLTGCGSDPAPEAASRTVAPTTQLPTEMSSVTTVPVVPGPAPTAGPATGAPPATGAGAAPGAPAAADPGQPPAAPAPGSPPAADPAAAACLSADTARTVAEDALGERVAVVDGPRCDAGWAAAVIDVGANEEELVSRAGLYRQTGGSWSWAESSTACDSGTVPSSLWELACNAG